MVQICTGATVDDVKMHWLMVGVIYPVTGMYDVPLMVARGYASLSFVYGVGRSPTSEYSRGQFD
jgi:hypothetical protein